MGAAVSQQKLIEAHGQLLEDFVCAKSWDFDNPFWQELLSFPVPLTKLAPQELEVAALPYCEALGELDGSAAIQVQQVLHIALSLYSAVRNNHGTHNLQTLLEHLLQKLQVTLTPDLQHGFCVWFYPMKRAAGLPQRTSTDVCKQTVDTPEAAQAATNAIMFARIFLKYSIESLNADDLVALLDAPIRAAKAKAATSNGTGECSNQCIDQIEGLACRLQVFYEQSSIASSNLDSLLPCL